MGIKLIYLLRGTAAVLVLLPAQKCYEKYSPFPYSCTSMQGSHFLLCIYLVMSYIESSLEKLQSTLIIKIMKNYVMRAYQACSGMYQRSRGWESHMLLSPYDLTSLFAVLTGCPVDGGVISTTSLCAPWETARLHRTAYGKSCFRISQLLELHLQVISCSILIVLLVEINVTHIYIKWNILTIVLMKMLVTASISSSSHKQEETFLQRMSFPEISVCYKLASALVW